MKTDGCAFLAGDSSVLVTQSNGFDQYFARGWVVDATTHGPASDGHVDSDVALQHLTLPDADVMLLGRTGRWREAVLVAPWTGTVRYRTTSEGFVQLEGSAQSPTGLAGRMFVLPSGYRPREGTPRTLLVAVRDPAAAESGVGQVTVQNGNPANVNAGAVTYAPIAGSGPYLGGTVVHFDGTWLPVRSNDGQMW